MSRAFFLLVCFASQLSTAQVTQNVMADEQPRYEIGAGLITLNVPDYPGAENNKIRAIAFPYFVYRGKYVRADDEGTRARLRSSKSHEFGLSMGVNFPVRSRDNPVREDMPDLDALVSIGPRFLYRFLPDSKFHKFNFSLATRAVFSSKFSFNNLLRLEGFAYEPRFSYWYRWAESKTTLFTSAGIEFGSAGYNQFFYNVPTHLITPERSEYSAQAGAIETSAVLGFGQQLSSQVFMFSAGSWRNLGVSANRESPLIASQDNWAFIFGLVWNFYQSEEKVKRLQVE